VLGARSDSGAPVLLIPEQGVSPGCEIF